MRLFGKVDGSINRFDRAQYMTPPFDKDLAAGSGTQGNAGKGSADGRGLAMRFRRSGVRPIGKGRR